jgi:transcriptional regulator with XRE-family HTH domain
MSALGHALRSARTRARLSQNELASRLGVSQGTISFWERGVEEPTLDNLAILLAQLPEMAQDLQARHYSKFRQLRQIERVLFNGRCACANCNCLPTEQVAPEPA